ncbi:bifunctional 23S rRNA (guanine(2069)-N(7))-methyltransferase RlmK/23S rRNA (guanine(2445)-N(2))-methyltransferase RlmL [Aeoliella mucimassa]|uniref:Ribosomal RNA large subunit methyltransferase K n=1 Tax=Aeoliella mucimassa TaxID=2527972 RepID=A0A518AR41_9BACT|nr:bifunctional 23S rRNA (guanine(2069)-N(7))-methyltransferase RlmK/23S rRNA (guanine(2445)-N(2))-methyltransferase RlmL [Aeoliella mucimassa]QDU57184.1 Ribosomal RNA large subunit methyltransferase K [Aeoliella mucimassa]
MACTFGHDEAQPSPLPSIPQLPASATIYELIATTAFGLEKLVVRELEKLGYAPRVLRPGRVAFSGDESAICRANLWLRTAERVVIAIGSFQADDFGLLFDGTNSLEWERWIPADGAFPVRGRSHKSQLSSVPACQKIVNKAVAERLLQAHHVAALPETGASYAIEVELFENTATLLLDTSGLGLHKRGYRTSVAEGQLRETLAAAMVSLSVWNRDRPMIDPFCGTGTIAIEAALQGRNSAPGIDREFAAEAWPAVGADRWHTAREEARDLWGPPLEQRIVATDLNPKSLELARHHAERAGVVGDIHFQQRDFYELTSSRQYGCLICNPPYGIRIGDERESIELHKKIPIVLRRLPTWSHYLLTARQDFERLIGQTATRRRKLYNGRIECTFYQFLGPRPPRRDAEGKVIKTPSVAPTDEHSPEQQAPAEQTPDEQRGDQSSHKQTAAQQPPQKQLSDTPKPARTKREQPAPVFGGLKEEAQRQAIEFANRLSKRARHLRRWPTRRGITCFRLYERDVPDVPLIVDRYEDALVIAEYVRPHERTAAEHADWLDLMVTTAAKTLEVDPKRVFTKFRQTQSGASQYDKFGSDHQIMIAHEGGLEFELNLSDYLDTGLFLDHRQTRSMVRDEAAGKRFLNLFAYTGSFTVYAAAGGAVSTTTVDLSPSYIEWAERNLKRNGFGGPQHQFLVADSREWVHALPSEPMFDLAVVDPPTFSNTKRTGADRQEIDDWDVQHHYAELLEALAERMSPEGVVYFSNNFRRFKFDENELPSYQTREISKQTVPEDFRNQRIHRCWRLVRKAGG